MMARLRNHNGVFTNNGRAPTRVITVTSRTRQKAQPKIQLDKLLKKENPVICVKRRLGGIGDVIMTTPMLAAIKKLIPHCFLIYVTDLVYSNGALGEAIQHCPYVDQIISVDQVKDSEYDYSVDVTTTGLDRERPNTIPPNRIDMFADEAGLSIIEDPVPTYIVTDDEREVAKKEIEEKYLTGAKREDIKLIAIQARSNDARRTWPFAYTKQLCEMLRKDKNIRILLMDWGGTVNEWEKAERQFPILNRTLTDTAALIEQCDLVVCPDSALLHLAGALDKKIVSIFGPIPSESRINHYPNAIAVQLQLPCKNCWYSPKCTKNSPIKAKMACLKNIRPEMVMEKIHEHLTSEVKPRAHVTFGKDISTGNQDNIILIRRTTPGLGDIIMAANAIEALKLQHPNCDIHVAVKSCLHEALENNPNISELIDSEKPINYKRYKMIFDISAPCAKYEIARLRMNRPVEKNRVEIYAEALGVRHLIKDILPRYYPTKEELKNALKFINKKCNPNKKNIVFALNSAEKYRNWPEQNYVKLAKLLDGKYNIITISELRGRRIPGTITYKNTSFREASAMIALADELITVDTGPLHVAAALGIPTIALFGPIDPRARCKGYKNTTVLASSMECVPCWRNANIKCKHKQTKNDYSKCLEKISPEKVFKIINQKLLK
jgi:ADP-heptose:LPS heptosyltransferase